MRLQIKYDWIVSICCLGDGDARAAAIDLFNHSHQLIITTTTFIPSLPPASSPPNFSRPLSFGPFFQADSPTSSHLPRNMGGRSLKKLKSELRS